jgi:hypothetical protein
LDIKEIAGSIVLEITRRGENYIAKSFPIFIFHHIFFSIVAYFFKARIVEPEKQPLLANGSETTLVSRQWPRNKRDKQPLLGRNLRDCPSGDYVGTPTDTNTTIVQQQNGVSYVVRAGML